MTRKDYINIAGAVSRTRMACSIKGSAIEKSAGEAALRLVATDLAATLRHDNPLGFNAALFLQNCGFAQPVPVEFNRRLQKAHRERLLIDGQGEVREAVEGELNR